jgi:hypothetical protein
VVTFKRRVRCADSRVTDKKVTRATPLLINRLFGIASDKKAQAILLTDRKVDDRNKNNDEKSTRFKGQLNSDYVYLSFTAQLITLCESPSWLCEKIDSL